MKSKKNVRIPKDEVINVRCTKAQKTKLETVAAARGMGVSTWLLFLALSAAEKPQ